MHWRAARPPAAPRRLEFRSAPLDNRNWNRKETYGPNGLDYTHILRVAASRRPSSGTLLALAATRRAIKNCTPSHCRPPWARSPSRICNTCTRTAMQAPKVKSWMPVRLLTGEGRTNGEETDQAPVRSTGGTEHGMQEKWKFAPLFVIGYTDGGRRPHVATSAGPMNQLVGSLSFANACSKRSALIPAA